MPSLTPTFEQLREKRELDVVYPETGASFRVSLRDWEGCLWAIRVHPHTPNSCDKKNPFVTAHRMMSRDSIEQWLSRLTLAQGGVDVAPDSL